MSDKNMIGENMSDDNFKKKVYFVTGNENKVDMFNKVVSDKLKVNSFNPSVEIEELESRSVREVVLDKLDKALTYFPEDNVFLFVTDVGIYIEQLEGRPGALIKRETKKLFAGNFHGWCDYLDDSKMRDAFIKVIIAAKNKEGKQILVEHDVPGIISKTPQVGPFGFAWDDVFVPREDLVAEEFKGLSFAQIPEDVKLKIFMAPPIRELERKVLES